MAAHAVLAAIPLTLWLVTPTDNERTIRVLVGTGLFALLVALVTLAAMGAGAKSVSNWLLVALPLAAAFAIGSRAGVAWTALALVTNIGLALTTNPPPQAGPAAARVILMETAMRSVLILALGWVGVSSRRATDRLVRDLETARDAAVGAADLKGRLLATVSHEIRTPLNSVAGVAELLLDSPLEHDQRELTGTIKSSVELMAGVVNSTLDLSRIEAGGMALENVDFDLRQAVESIADLLATPAAQKGVDVVCHMNANVPDVVRGDPTRFRQIVLNLAGNAVKFTSGGHVALVVSRAESDMVRIDVADTGIGIPSERLATIFDPFTQASASTARTHGGSGLGLTITSRLVDLMGGRIAVESDPGHGSTFSVNLPLPAVRLHSGTEMTQARETLTARRVLVAAPVHVAEPVAAILRDTGHMKVWVAHDDRQLWSTLRGDLDLVVVDESLTTDLNAIIAAGPGSETAALPCIRLLAAASPGGSDADTLRLPVRRDDLVALALRTVSSDTTRPSDAGGPPRANGVDAITLQKLKGMRVLLAEDDDLNRRIALAQLAQLGVEALGVSNGLEALEMVADDGVAFDAILLDGQMPHLDGYATASEIRRIETLYTPIIAVTGEVFPEDLARCREAGMDDHLAKPHTIEGLAEKLAAWRMTTHLARSDQGHPDPTAP
ncbi:MAG: response regulator [Acidimicrobiia bacterium]|nr:response regulator [Acidimicrobiia bacterium]